MFDHPDTSKELQLIDFEWSFPRSALLDATYLRMSFPTCWCAKALPREVIQALDREYRHELQRTLDVAKEDLLYEKEYIYACAFWVLQQTLHFISDALEKDKVGPSGPVPEHSLWVPEKNTVRPRAIARLNAFLEIAQAANQLPQLTYMAQLMLKKLALLWPEKQTLEFYPAFSGFNSFPETS